MDVMSGRWVPDEKSMRGRQSSRTECYFRVPSGG